MPSPKTKRKSPHHAEDTSKPSALFTPSAGRTHTLTVALPGSIIANAQSHELKTQLAGTIARALAVFCVDEVVVFDDGQGRSRPTDGFSAAGAHYTGDTDPVHFLAHVLSYLEAPPHLRRALFALHPNLRSAGALPSLDMPHHLRAGEWCRWREGVAVAAPGASPAQAENAPPRKKRKPAGPPADSHGALADVGLAAPVRLPAPVPLGARVTVDLGSDAPPTAAGAAAHAEAVAPAAPREVGGYYWGFSVRTAASLSAVYTEAPFAGGYDVSIGTSERGVALADLPAQADAALRGYEHLVVFFGGVAGLEKAVEADGQLAGKEAAECFDAWIDVCPGQGSRTIRTEEAVWLGLMGLRPWVRGREGA